MLISRADIYLNAEEQNNALGWFYLRVGGLLLFVTLSLLEHGLSLFAPLNVPAHSQHALQWLPHWPAVCFPLLHSHTHTHKPLLVHLFLSSLFSDTLLTSHQDDNLSIENFKKTFVQYLLSQCFVRLEQRMGLCVFINTVSMFPACWHLQ